MLLGYLELLVKVIGNQRQNVPSGIRLFGITRRSPF